MTNLREIVLILAVIAFSIGAVRPGIFGVDWQAAGLALAALSLAL
jgi:hypothetical protein